MLQSEGVATRAAPGLGNRARPFLPIQKSSSFRSFFFLLGVVSSQQQVAGVGFAGTVCGEGSNRKSRTVVGPCHSNCPRALPRPLVSDAARAMVSDLDSDPRRTGSRKLEPVVAPPAKYSHLFAMLGISTCLQGN
jgi:hypothetical protein